MSAWVSVLQCSAFDCISAGSCCCCCLSNKVAAAAWGLLVNEVLNWSKVSSQSEAVSEWVSDWIAIAAQGNNQQQPQKPSGAMTAAAMEQQANEGAREGEKKKKKWKKTASFDNCQLQQQCESQLNVSAVVCVPEHSRTEKKRKEENSATAAAVDWTAQRWVNESGYLWIMAGSHCWLQFVVQNSVTGQNSVHYPPLIEKKEEEKEREGALKTNRDRKDRKGRRQRRSAHWRGRRTGKAATIVAAGFTLHANSRRKQRTVHLWRTKRKIYARST